jgi:hypothetical protein
MFRLSMAKDSRLTLVMKYALLAGGMMPPEIIWVASRALLQVNPKHSTSPGTINSATQAIAA